MATKTEIRAYSSMFEYVADADISHYDHSNADNGAPDTLIEVFQPIDDPYFVVDWDDETEVNGKTYIRVCWGELEKSYLVEDAIYECCYVRYELDGRGAYVSDGIVYDTQDDAQSGGR